MATLVAIANSAGVATHGCRPEFLAHFFRHETHGPPLRLRSVSCIDFQAGTSGTSQAIVSPDGEAVARWHHGSRPAIEIAPIDGEVAERIPNRATFRSFSSAGTGFGGTPDALAWSSDAQALWSVSQETMIPSGFALAGLRPIRISRTGEIKTFPAPADPAGPLDAVLWVGGDGVALAQFGTRGGYYQPEHDDPRPTVAIIDAARSRIRSRLPIEGVAALRERLRHRQLRFNQAAAIRLPDGRVKAVIRLFPWAERPDAPPGPGRAVHGPDWLVWAEGQSPSVWHDPYPADRANALALTPDGSKLLVVRPLQPDGPNIQYRYHRPDRPRQPPPRPVSGPIAELIDIPTRRVIWQLTARAERFWSQRSAPVISPDGRLALVELPPDGNRLPIGLVSIRDGHRLTTFTAFQFGSHAANFGFANDGQSLWLAGANVLIRYEIDLD